MKKTLLTIFCITLLLAPLTPASASGAAVDFSMRRAIYFTGAKTGDIDLKNDHYVAENQQIAVKASDAVSCNGQYCKFNLGVIVFKQGAEAASPYAQLTVAETSAAAGDNILFSASATTKTKVFTLTLSKGKNTVVFKVDPQNQVAESNERNNTFRVMVIVQ